VSPLATRFQELYELSSTQISVVIATPVILGSLFPIPIGLLTDRFGGRAVFSALMLVLIVPVLFIGLLGGSFGGLLFWGFFLGLAASSFAAGVPFVNKWFPPHMQGLVLGIYGMGNIVSAIAAYAAPAIAAFYGWQWAFWVFILPLAAMAIAFWILGRDAPQAGPRPSGIQTAEVKLDARRYQSPEEAAKPIVRALKDPASPGGEPCIHRF